MLVLDTCTLLFLAADKRKLSQGARAALGGAGSVLGISAISGFEIAARYRARLLQLPLPPGEWFAEALAFHAVRELPVTGAIAARAALWPAAHDDLCDRVIAATAIEHHADIVTPDALLADFPGVSAIW